MKKEVPSEDLSEHSENDENRKEEADKTPPKKKVRLSFSPKEFRKQLKTEQKAQALQGFLRSVSEENRIILTYLEHGGSPLEILQMMEGDFGAAPSLVFEVLNIILLEIGAKLSQFQNAAVEASRYLLSTYITQINKMLGLASSMNERVSTLRLLTTIVTFSATLAKDILLNVNFNPNNIELLTKVGEIKNEARFAYIHFLVAYLVGGHFSTLSVLLEKRGLMTSIVRNLQYDEASVVVLALTAMKNHILENPSVSKTLKMKTFNTVVVKDIVNLYNWKGPAGISELHKKGQVKKTVDEVDKSKVSEAVHSFLLILCTSHKFGVIFKDPNVGSTGHKTNSLMVTVLENLVRPWEHSYAGDLVLKICKACPDLTKTIWSNLKRFLEPRWTDKWLKAMKFAENLVEVFQPDLIDFSQLNETQLSKVLYSLTSPFTVLKVLISKDQTFDVASTRYHILSLILKMLISLENFLLYFDTAQNVNVNFAKLRFHMKTHIINNFPHVDFILQHWNETDENLTVSHYLNTAFDVLTKYKVLTPEKLKEVNLDFDLSAFISGNDEISLKIKVVNFFIDIEPTLCKVESELYKTVLLFLIESYHYSKDSKILTIANQLLRNSDLFQGNLNEVNFWVDAILNLNSFDINVGMFLYDLLKISKENTFKFNENFLHFENANFSVMIFALVEYFNLNGSPSKNIKKYISFVLLNVFHSQTDTSFIQIVCHLEIFSENLLQYFCGWNNEACTLNKCKGNLMKLFSQFSSEFLEASDITDFTFDFYPNHKFDILQAHIFYLTQLMKLDSLQDHHKKKAFKFIEFLFTENVFTDLRYVEAILLNTFFLDKFTVFNTNNFATKFLLDVLKKLNNLDGTSILLNFQRKSVSAIMKLFKKPEKYANLNISTDVLETISLDYNSCCKVVTKYSQSLDNRHFFPIVCYCLNRIAELGKHYDVDSLDNSVILDLSKIFVKLIDEQNSNIPLFSSALQNYLNIFKNNIGGVESELFAKLLQLTEFNKDNLSLCEFLLERNEELWASFEKHLDEVCSKRSFILSLLNLVLQHYNDENTLQKIYQNLEPHIVKALQKPHKAGQHFQNNYKSLAVLVDKFYNNNDFVNQVLKFETTEFFHVFLLKTVFNKVEKKEKKLNNMVLTFVHLLTNLLKQKSTKSVDKVSEIAEIVYNFLLENKNSDLSSLNNNETFKLFCKLCLKYGIAGDHILIKILSHLIEKCLNEEEAGLIFEMFFSHSQFLDVMLGDGEKFDLLNLWKAVCIKWPQAMQKDQIPVLLASYNGTNQEKIVLELLKMYESKHDQTNFFDFKPFLWGRAAASHYSVRSDIRSSLFRQPKTSDVLNSLHIPTIEATISNPLHPNSYDLDYFLPLFSNLLAPENPVATYNFTRRGALALALVGFSDETHFPRVCHVLQRFYFHLESKQSGKDSSLWLRFIEAICKGFGVFEDFKINSFAAIFLARTALVMTQLQDVMYQPLSQYLVAKDVLDFSTIPELYTFLHSSHVDSKHHKVFILKVIRDALKGDNDFKVFLKTMAFKLISELCSSSVCDEKTKLLVLDIFEACCDLEKGVKVFGEIAFLPQIFALIFENIKNGIVLRKLLTIVLKFVKRDSERSRCYIVYFNLIALINDENNHQLLLDSGSLTIYYNILYLVTSRFPNFFKEEHFIKFLQLSKDKLCNYMHKYGYEFFTESDFYEDCDTKFLRLMLYKYLSNKN